MYGAWHTQADDLDGADESGAQATHIVVFFEYVPGGQAWHAELPKFFLTKPGAHVTHAKFDIKNPSLQTHSSWLALGTLFS